MLIARTAPRWLPKRPRVVTGGSPPPVSDFIPQGAVAWFDSSLIAGETAQINTWNNGIVAASRVNGGYPNNPSYTMDMTGYGMGCRIQCKNNTASKPRIVAGGAHKGAINCMRAKTAHTDPNGGPNYVLDGNENTSAPESIQRAHAYYTLVKPDGTAIKIPRGQWFEMGLEFLFPSQETSKAAFALPSNNWTILQRISSTDGDSVSMFALRANHYGFPATFFACTAHDPAGAEVVRFHGMGESTVDSAGGGTGPKEEYGVPWELDTVYQSKIRGVLDPEADARSWIEWELNGVLKAYNSGFRAGKNSDATGRDVTGPSYSGYRLDVGGDRAIRVFKTYVHLGATGYPPRI